MSESRKYLYQHKQHVLYGWNAITAELVAAGHVDDLIVVDERDERIQDLLPKKPVVEEPKLEPRRSGVRKNSQPDPVELPASVLENSKA
jgi:hypothetical protein